MWALLFVLQKPIFLAIYGTADSGLADTFSVIYHGLSLDFSMAGYLTVLPGLILLVSALPFRRGRVVLVWAERVIFALSALAVATMPRRACHHTTLAIAAEGEETMKKIGVESRGNCQ